jgi:serine/threonine protein phosphatase PrpC
MKLTTLSQLQSRLYKWLMRRTTASAIRRVGELPVAIISDIGNVRKENQDRLAVLKVQLELDESFLVIALCDGMGGMAEGSACASQAIASFFISCISNRNIAPSNRLAIAAQDANRQVCDLYKGGGGGTLSAVLFDSNGGMTGVNIGDSRIYSYREGMLEQITIDDTLAGLRPKANDDLHARNELLQYIGMGDGLEPHIIESPSSWDLMLLTSDGTHYFDKGVMQMVIQNAREPAVAARRLVEIAKWCGGRDNASMAIVAPMIVKEHLLDDAGLIQVWDPFGELQMFVAETITLDEIIKEPTETTPSTELGRQHHRKNAPKAPRKKPKPKNRRAKKAAVEEPKEHDEGGEKRPQLNIYFNGDIDKDRND